MWAQPVTKFFLIRRDYLRVPTGRIYTFLKSSRFLVGLKYHAETIDIGEVEFEECDLEFDNLFPSDNQVVNSPTDD